MRSLPSSTDKWMCPNHIEPILDRYLLRKKKLSTSERVKIYQQYSQIEHKTIIQDFIHMRQKKSHLLWETFDNHRLERIDVSQIPKVIEEFYFNANMKSKAIDLDEIEDNSVQVMFNISFSSSISRFLYRLPFPLMNLHFNMTYVFGIHCKQC